MRIFITIFLLVFLANQASSQVKLQMDKFGKRKTLDFHEGDVITVKLKGEEVYQQLQIQKLYPEANLIVTQLGPVKLDDIIRVRTFDNKGVGRYFAYMLWVFGAAWGGYSLLGYLVYAEPLTWGVLGVMGVSFLLGWFLKWILRRRTYKIGKKRKMRIIDINIKPFNPKPS